MAESKSLRVAYGEALVELGAKNENIVVMDADLAHVADFIDKKIHYRHRHKRW